MRRLALFLLLFAIVGSAEERVPVPVVRGAKIVDFGIYDAIRIGEENAPDTAEGKIHVTNARIDPSLLKQTDRIPAKLSLRFGFRYEVQGEPELETIPIHVRVTHPYIANPVTKKSTTTDEWDSETNIGLARYVGWSFDEQYELQAGDWKIEVIHKGKVLVSKKFSVTLW